MTKLDEILSDLEFGAEIAAMFPAATGPALLADQLLKIVQAAVKAHEATTGKTLDPTLLHQITPV